MARVLIATQAWGVIQDRSGNVSAGTTVTIKNTDGSAATHWSAQTGGSSSTADQNTDSNGGIQRWLEEGEYDVTVGGTTSRVQASGRAAMRLAPPPSGGDDTARLQEAITACPAGETLGLRLGTYTITSALTIDHDMTLAGAGVHENRGSQSVAFETIDLPIGSPPLRGSVIVQNTAATDAIQITAAGVNVNLRDFGIRFGTPFANTGNGISAVPPAYLTGKDNGILNPRWDNVIVWGHDGDHYGFYMVNPILGTFTHIRSYGGGGLKVENDSPAGGRNYGNLVFIHPYFYVCDAGAGHAVYLKSPALNSGAATNGGLNIMSFTRPQCWVRDVHLVLAATSAPTSAQKLWEMDSAVQSITLVAPNMETNVSSQVNWTAQLAAIGQHYLGPGTVAASVRSANTKSQGGSIPTEGVSVEHSNAFLKVQQTTAGARAINFAVGSTDATVYIPEWLGRDGSGTDVTATMQAGAGTTPPAAVVTGAKALGGKITFGTGTTPAAGALIQVNYARSQPFTSPVPCVTPANAATQALGLYVSAQAAGSFTVACATAPAASQGNTIYAFNYQTVA